MPLGLSCKSVEEVNMTEPETSQEVEWPFALVPSELSPPANENETRNSILPDEEADAKLPLMDEAPAASNDDLPEVVNLDDDSSTEMPENVTEMAESATEITTQGLVIRDTPESLRVEEQPAEEEEEIHVVLPEDGNDDANGEPDAEGEYIEDGEEEAVAEDELEALTADSKRPEHEEEDVEAEDEFISEENYASEDEEEEEEEEEEEVEEEDPVDLTDELEATDQMKEEEVSEEVQDASVDNTLNIIEDPGRDVSVDEEVMPPSSIVTTMKSITATTENVPESSTQSAVVFPGQGEKQEERQVVEEILGEEATETGDIEVTTTLPADAIAVDVNIPVLHDNIDAESLEETIRSVVANVTKEFTEEMSEATKAMEETTLSLLEDNENELTTLAMGTETTTDVPSIPTTTSPTPVTSTESKTHTTTTPITASTTITTTATTTTSQKPALPRRLDESTVQVSLAEVDKKQDTECVEGFACGGDNTTCIDLDRRCDLIRDCQDGSDEEGCDESVSCDENEFFPCSSGRCVPQSRRCDRRADCPNAEDELGCEGECEPGHFFCSEGRCLPEALRCDGEKHCFEGEDEFDCECASDQMRCAVGGGCVAETARCDGKSDCADGSDEWGCLQVSDVDGLLQIRLGDDQWLPVCADAPWNETWSEVACQRMGAVGIISHNVTRSEGNMTFGKLAEIGENSLQSAIVRSEEGDACEGGFLTLQCEEPVCSAWPEPREEDEKDESPQWPSLAYLFSVSNKDACTASVVHPKWLLTSWQCVESMSSDPSQWVAFGGPANRAASEESDSLENLSAGTQIKMVEQFVKHPSAHFDQGFQV